MILHLDQVNWAVYDGYNMYVDDVKMFKNYHNNTTAFRSFLQNMPEKKNNWVIEALLDGIKMK